MSVSITWDDRFQKKLHASLHGLWTWDDYYAGLEQIVAMTEDVDHEVMLIVDLTHSGEVPVASLRGQVDRVQSALDRIPEAISMIVVVDPNAGRWVRSWMARIAVNLFDTERTIITVESIDNAYAAIGQRRLLTA